MRRLTVHAELGWAFLPNTYAVADRRRSVAPRNGPIARLRFEFEQPRLFWRPSLRWRNSLEIDRTLEQTYDAFSTRAMTGVVWQVRSTLSIFPSYRLEADYLDGSPINSAVTTPLTLGCKTTGDSCLVWLSYLDGLLQWDRRDKVFDPRRGTYFSLSLQQGGGPLGGDFKYVRVLPDARVYGSFGDGDALTLSARLRAGELHPWSGNPRRQRGRHPFLRGRLRSRCAVSPIAACRRCCWRRSRPRPNVQITLPIGGNGLIDGSFEARYSLTSLLRLAAFVDFGQVTHGLLGPDDIAAFSWAVPASRLDHAHRTDPRGCGAPVAIR